ncbi:hypothetical protein CO058_02835 [candidate division WWE3 bacterium CG_4_9_14_0_2_um_filter_35_11]|uniref:PIN domain-containing protein n=1 Tax=candidate division WWE3 bacterium CG_4_9_14_0_2_um_filter_35_11 TaxID=1975077 RepID=A0A2M8ELA8_UNCKA|nr:MAG: hypothetical protein COV25_01765 [candidate division WWE3 bacterium CG10_big_fil_rev_8_21_14_0_10_35_32]PJC23519.1 MAG: hypothetical protein CO058_02835 [candidate division WWE3 bacterium CG_4_9_14_0_2_um_filter_35_11]
MKNNLEVYIDTNFYLRFVFNDIPKQNQKCRSLIESAKSGRCDLHLTEETICEIVYVLLKLYKLNRKEIKEDLSFFLSHKFVRNENKRVVFLALEIFLGTNLSIVDSVLVSKASFHGRALATFDEDLLKVSKAYKVPIV